jgi:MFS family permease
MSPSYAALFGARYRALMVAALGATFLGSLDALMVTTALPTAAQDIGGVDLIAVTVGATAVTVAMTFPLAGTVIDRYGVGRSFAIACGLFTVANVVGGLAPSMAMVAVSRAILGLGAGFMFSVPLGLFAVSVPEALRPRAFGANAAMWGVSALIGPALGAILTGTIGWRWVFWVNLPMIAGVAWAARLALRGQARPPAHAARHALNLVGPMLLGLMVALLLALARQSLPAALLVAAALAAAAAFVWYERRTPLPVFTHTPNSLAANVSAFASGAAFLGAETYLPLQLQVGFAHSVAVVGLSLLLCTAGWTTGSVGAARVSASPRNQVALGTALTFVATAVMAIPAGGALLPIAAYTVSGLGMGISSPALFAAVLADRREGREGQATSSIPLARQVGSGVGAAVAGIVFASALTAHQVALAQRSGAHVPSVVDAARLTYIAVAGVGLLGVVACHWLTRTPERAPAVEPDRVAA